MKAGRPSRTAKLVARSQILACRDPKLRRLLPLDAERILARFHAVGGGGFQVLMKWKWFRSCCQMFERIALPGITTHYLARKIWIEIEVRRALAGGARRVVVMGAGYDTMAWRLSAEFPDIDFFELDHPATLAEKACSLPLRKNLHLVALDLEQDSLRNALGGDAADEAPAVVIAEGLTMYLREPRVAALLRDAAEVAGRGGCVLFSYMEKRQDCSIHFLGQHPLVRRWLDRCGESFHWGIEHSRLTTFLAGCGLAASEPVGPKWLRKTILLPLGLQQLPLAHGEFLCVSHPIHS